MIIDQPRFATRLNSFRRGSIGVDAALAAVAAVPGISAVELNYPQHVADRDAAAVRLARSLGLEVTALNLRFDGAAFQHGAFTHPVPANRQQAVQLCLDAVELAEAERIGHVILWMGPDGWDYPFQCDHALLWQQEIDGFREIAAHRPEIQVSVEYKPSDPRRRSLVRTMADSLLAVSDVGRANFGVTLDFCHALMAGESPAAAAALALSRGKLFGVHLNDGYGAADDGLMVGSVHLIETLELLFLLRQAGFPGTLYFDTFPEGVDPAAECAANIQQVRRLLAILDRLDVDTLNATRAAQDSIGAIAIVNQAIAESERG